MVFTRLNQVRIYVLSFARAKVNKNKAATEAIPYLSGSSVLFQIFICLLYKMCGIAGIISTDPSFASKERVKEMTTAMVHRGPDAEGHWADTNVALGNRRLAIIDLSNAGQQPMHYMDRYVIVHNGEVYNYVELKEELRGKGYSFVSKTDTEVIAAAYDHWNGECVDHFDGMFSFAIWDKKEKELFAARDRFGEKPFFTLSIRSDLFLLRR